MLTGGGRGQVRTRVGKIAGASGCCRALQRRCTAIGEEEMAMVMLMLMLMLVVDGDVPAQAERL